MPQPYTIILAPNPSIMTGPGTNTIILGGGVQGALVIDLPVDDKDSRDAAAHRSRLHNGIQVGAIVHGRINDQRTLGTTAKNKRIRARPRHNRGVRGQDDCVWLWHE